MFPSPVLAATASPGGVNWILLGVALAIFAGGGFSLLIYYRNLKRRQAIETLRARRVAPSPQETSQQIPLDAVDPRRGYDKAVSEGDWSRAALYAQRMKDTRRYAEAVEKSGDLDRAISAWVELEQFDRAAQLHEKAGAPLKAAKLYAQAGLEQRAIQCFIAGGQPEKAVPMLREVGDERGALVLEAQIQTTKGDHVTAARHLIAAGDYEAAARSLLAAGDIPKAVEALRRAGKAVDAARILRDRGDPLSAAQLFEEAGAWQDAAGCYGALNDSVNRERCIARGGDGYAAGRAAFERGDLESAQTFFESIPPLDDRFVDAGLFRGQIYERKGMLMESADAYALFLKRRSPDEKNKFLFLKLAQILEGIGRTKEALRILGRVITAGFASQDVTAWAARLERGNDSAIETQAHEEPSGLKDLDRLQLGREGSQPAIPLREEKPPAGPRGRGGPSDGEPPAIAELDRRYKFGERMGQGGNGVVYLATDRALGRDVVVKFLHQALLPTEVARKYFLREAKTAASLSHPNIVTIFDIGEEGESLYYSMEWVRGKTLADVIIDAGGKLTHAECVPLITQFCEALEYAHDHQVIHRDIKPGNVMVTHDGRVKLLDFGLAKALDENPDKSVFLCGTPFYMSPEQIQRGFLDHRTDIYSLGCMLYVMYTGDVPFPEGNVFYHQQHTPAPDPQKIVPELPQGVSAVLMKCVAKDRDQRFQRATEVARALAACG